MQCWARCVSASVVAAVIKSQVILNMLWASDNVETNKTRAADVRGDMLIVGTSEDSPFVVAAGAGRVNPASVVLVWVLV